MIDELIAHVARGSGLNAGQAAQAVDAMLRFMAARLPSPLFGELQAHLKALPPSDEGGGAGHPAQRP